MDAGTPCRAREVCEAGLTCVPKNPLMFANGHPCKEGCSCDNGKLTCTLVCAPTNVTCPPLPATGNTCIGGQICQVATGAGEIIQCTCSGKPDAGPREPWFCF